MMRWLVLLVMMLPAYAQAEDRLGRLFMTPVERSNLDYLRKSSKPPEKILPAGEEGQAAEEGNVAVSAPSAPPAVVTVQGYVKRSDGKGTVWVNRRPVQEKSTQGEISVGKLGGRDNRVQLKVPGSDKVINLKAGQSYDPVSGMIVDNPGQLPETQASPLPPQDKSATPTPAPEAPKKP